MHDSKSELVNIEQSLAEELGDLEGKKFKNRLDISKITDIKEKLNEIHLEKSEIINYFEKQEHKASLKIPTTEKFKLFATGVIDKLEKSHLTKNSLISGLTDELKVRQNKFNEDFELMISQLVEKIHTPSPTGYDQSAQETLQDMTKENLIVKPAYFSVFKERSIAGLKDRLVELKAKIEMLRQEDSLSTFELETNEHKMETLGSDLKILKARFGGSLEVEKIMGANYEEIETLKIGSHLQMNQILGKVNIEKNAFYKIAAQKMEIIEKKFDQRVEIRDEK
jgi:hypothetical protein